MKISDESLLHQKAKFFLFDQLCKRKPMKFISDQFELNPYKFFNTGPFLEMPRRISNERWAFLDFNSCKKCFFRQPNKRDFSCASWCLKGLRSTIRSDISVGNSKRETIFFEIVANSAVSPEKILHFDKLSSFFSFFVVEVEALSLFHYFEEILNFQAKNIFKF